MLLKKKVKVSPQKNEEGKGGGDYGDVTGKPPMIEKKEGGGRRKNVPFFTDLASVL